LNERTYVRIGEIAVRFGVTVKALRLYEKKGILAPALIDPRTGYRLYGEEQAAQLGALLELKSLGFTLSDIKELLSGGGSGEEMRYALRKKRIAWQDKRFFQLAKAEAVDKILTRIENSGVEDDLSALPETQRIWLLYQLLHRNSFTQSAELGEALWL
jgi:DNA-binding transcriptional MerR regulator